MQDWDEMATKHLFYYRSRQKLRYYRWKRQKPNDLIGNLEGDNCLEEQKGLRKWVIGSYMYCVLNKYSDVIKLLYQFDRTVKEIQFCIA